MNSFKKDKKEDEGPGNAYMALDKTAVLQEARYFNESPLNAKKCIGILTKILFIISRGDKLSRTEATDTFFAMTKLFQNKDLNLRRMVYLVIKEMSTLSDDVIIVTSCLQKDVTDKDQSFRAPALRTLCKIVEPSTLQIFERHIKEGIVNRNSPYACAAILSAYHLMQKNPDFVRRCANEVQEAASSDKQMVQYHALGLLYNIRRIERGSVVQMLQRFIKAHVRSSFGHCLLIRTIFNQLQSEETARDNEFLEFLDSSLRHKSEMVVYEAARAIVNLRNVSSQRLNTAINVFQVFCSSPKSVMRYAAVKTLNSVAVRMPQAAVNFNTDLESLISDSNRSIATLAITTLLKVGNEHNVDRLIKQISTFMSEISDEFKVVVVESVRNLASKYPKKHQSMLSFLSSLLRDNDGYKFKKVVVSTVESIIREIPEARSAGLIQLCEFIEDCEHTKLTQRILYLIGKEGPLLPNCRKFIRYIYNRIMLEDAPVRCTATTALARFGALVPDLLPSVLVLLSRISLDEDDEVRDRAVMLHHLLISDNKSCAQLITSDMQVSVAALERMLRQYYQCQQQTVQPFDLQQVPKIVAPVVEKPTDVDLSLIDVPSVAGSAAPSVTNKPHSIESGGVAGPLQEPTVVSAWQQGKYIEELSRMPQLRKLGPLFKSNAQGLMFEEDITVTCIKHMYKEHVVIQYNCTNTMKNVRLRNVQIEINGEMDGVECEGCIPCDCLEYDVPGKVYLLLRFTDPDSICMTTIDSKLVFQLIDLSGDGEETNQYDDEYPLENLEITLADNIIKVMKGNYDAAWNELGDAHQREEALSFSSISTIEDMVKKLEELGFQPCEGTNKVESNRSSHTLLLAGIFRGGHDVLINCKIVKGIQARGVNVQFLVRCSDDSVLAMIFDALN